MKSLRLRSLRLGASLLVLVLGSLAPAATAQQATGSPVTILHNFTGPDGRIVHAGLVQGRDGNLYGVASAGGANDLGTFYQVTPAGAVTALHDFSYPDGAYPDPGLIQGSDGNFYGTANQDGANGNGTIFKITAAGVLTTFHDFRTSASEGGDPVGSLVQGSDGNFYGTTRSGGAGSAGTVYKITPAGVFTSLYGFPNTGPDGRKPYAGLVQAGNGNFYGSTSVGGTNDLGTIYQITSAGVLTTLHSFTGAASDGANPYGGLVQGSDGNLYGATYAGGTNDAGTIYKITPAGVLTTLHSFTSTDGTSPYAALVQGSDGNFYGSTLYGGAHNDGTLFRITAAGALTTLYSFTYTGADGAYPYGALVQAADGSFYGTTAAGGYQADGTVFRLDPAAFPGVLQFSGTGLTVNENDGSATVAVSRLGTGLGAVTVNVSTGDGSAVAGVDYTGTSSTLSWADGDTADKTFTVPLLDPGLLDGSTRTFSVVLSAPGGGATLGTPATEMVSIFENDTAPQPTIEITSPPANITLITGTAITLSAAVTDPGGLLSEVDFFLNGAPFSQTTGHGPFTKATTAPAPGTYELKAVAIGTGGAQSVSVRTVTVVAPDPAVPVPATTLVTDLNMRLLAGGTNVTLAATADAFSTDGSPLARVDFYADNTLIASYDGQGNPLTSGTRPGARRRTADAGGGQGKNGNVFTAVWSIPNLSALVNLLTVATTQNGLSTMSAPVTVRTAATSATSDHAPVAILQNVTNGQQVSLGTTLTVPVNAYDPDAGTSAITAARRGAAATGRRLSDIGVPGSVISKVEYFLGKTKIGAASAPPYSFDVTPTAAGSFVIGSIVTDDAGLSGVADPVVIDVVAPVVSISVKGANKASVNENGSKVKLTVTRTGDDLSQPLTVNYKAKGSAVAGVNYKPLSGSVTIPAGAASAKVKVRPLDDQVSGADTVVKFKLTPSADGKYSLGIPAKVKLSIVNTDPAP